MSRQVELGQSITKLLPVTVIGVSILPVQTVEVQGQRRIRPYRQADREQPDQGDGDFCPLNADSANHRQIAVPPSTVPTVIAAPIAPHCPISSQPMTAWNASAINVTVL